MIKAFHLVKKELHGSLFDYLLLGTSGVFFLLFLKMFQSEKLLSFITLFMFTCFYVVWGIYHHSAEETITPKVVVEYILIGLTAMLLLTVIFT